MKRHLSHFLLALFLLVSAASPSPAHALFRGGMALAGSGSGGGSSSGGSSSSSGGGTSSSGGSSSGGFASLPTVSSAPLAIYSPYQVRSAYTGPLFQLTRVSDSATMDVYPDSNGAPNTLSISTFLSGATYAAVTKEYDQSGNGNDTPSGVKLWCFNAINGIYSITHDPYLPAGSLKFSIPSSVTGTLNSVTRVSVQSYTSSNAAGIGLLGPTYGGSTTLGIRSASSYKATLGVNAGGTFNGVTSARSRSQPQVTIVSSGAANLVTYQDGVANTFAAASANTWAGGYIGYVDSISNLNGEFYFDAIYPTALNSTDEATLRTYLNSRFNILTSSDTQLIIAGNSIVQGTQATFNHNNQWYMQQALSRPIFISNQGVAGQLASTEYANISTYTAQYRSDLAHNLIIAPEATNDIDAQGAGTIVGYGTSIFNSAIVPFVQAAKTAGFDVIVPTMLPRNWTGTSSLISQKTTEQQAYNTLVINNAATYGYTVVDYAGIPQASNPSNTSYYADGIHPTSTLYSLMGNLLASVINPKLSANDNPSPNLYAANDNPSPDVYAANDNRQAVWGKTGTGW